tara:strand:+ start:370 stop:573 length:204 start_codon:yes stop_codon:yes gene_type:complete
MTEKAKTELKKLFTANPGVSVLNWMVVATLNQSNALKKGMFIQASPNEVWDCYEEWQEEGLAEGEAP